MGTLKAIREIIVLIATIIKKFNVFQKKKKVEEAFENSVDDQRPIEEAISGTSGNPTKYKYAGLRTRKAKKRH